MREKWKIKQKNLLFKVRNSHLELEKDFIELKDIQLKNREVKIKKDYCVYRWYGKVLKKKKWRKEDQWKTIGVIGYLIIFLSL